MDVCNENVKYQNCNNQLNNNKIIIQQSKINFN